MTKTELETILEKLRVNKRNYCLEEIVGWVADDMYVLSEEHGDWHVFYAERGCRFSEKIHPSEDAACRDMLNRLTQHSFWRRILGRLLSTRETNHFD